MGKIHPTAWVAPGAFLRGDVTLGEKVSIWYNAVLRADQEKIVIGKGSNVQDNCVIHGDPGHDVIVGENVTVGHGAILHGCTIEDQCLIGMNAVVLDNTVIGEGSIVGAGAVVGSGQTIPPRSLVLGVPAKVKKTLTEAESAGNLENVEEYFPGERGRILRSHGPGHGRPREQGISVKQGAGSPAPCCLILFPN